MIDRKPSQVIAGAVTATSHASASALRGPIDLRGFIQTLDAAGRLVRVRDRIHWRYEIGRRSRESRAPTLFEDIEGYPGQKIFTNGLSDRGAIALALGLEPETSRPALVAELRRRIVSPLPPLVVETGPVREAIVRARAVDLLRFPIPWWSELDAGRYIGTWHINVTKNPETGARNVGVYRMQVLSPRTATVSASAGSDLTRHVLRAEAEREALPMALAIGVPEAVVMAAAAAYPPGGDQFRDEFELAGALRGHPLQLIRCGTVDLEVPATAEIVVEGFIHPGERAQDGPYLDYCGRTNTNPEAFVFEATQMMFRSEPVFRGAAIGIPGAEDHQVFSLLAALGLLDFHGSQWKQRLENALLRRSFFKTMQGAGKLRSRVKALAGRPQ